MALFQPLLIECLCFKAFFQTQHNHHSASTLQKEGSERYMDTGNKVMCAPYVDVNSPRLSPTQRLIAEALTQQGLNVETACVYSRKSTTVDPPRQRMYSSKNTSLCLLFSLTALHCDDKASLVQPDVEVCFPMTKQGQQIKKTKQGGSAAGKGDGVKHCRGDGVQGVENEEKDSTPSFVFTIFAPLTPCHLWIGQQTSKSFAAKIKNSRKDEFTDEELQRFHMHPCHLYMFSGAFPHAGGNYSELNVREFFRVYTSNRPGSNQDQHYFEVRKEL